MEPAAFGATTREAWLAAHPYLLPVARVDDAVAAALAGAAPEVPLPKWDAYLADYHAGTPLLRSADAGLNVAPAAAELLGELTLRLGADLTLPPRLRERCGALAESFDAGDSACVRALQWVLSGGEEGEAPVEPGLARYLGWTAAARALAPVVAAFATARDEARWGHGRCPTCGARPVMSWLVPGEGVRERQLSCGCCATRWAFQRIGCAYCGNADSGLLGILETDGESGLRLELCDQCHGYIKTCAGDGDPALLLADWTSLHLDLLARERGYSRSGDSLYEL